MYVKIAKLFILLIFLAHFVSCFGGGIDKTGMVVKYKNGTVFTKGGGRFSVGEVGKSWNQKKTKDRAILFVNEDTGSTIGVDSFCGGSFEDGPLNILTNQLFYGMTREKILKTQKTRIGNREALRTVKKAEVDGAESVLDVVVLKMNKCVYDFFYISSPSDYAEGKHDFESFYAGFRFIR